jgi:hypothetical protein
MPNAASRKKIHAAAAMASARQHGHRLQAPRNFFNAEMDCSTPARRIGHP